MVAAAAAVALGLLTPAAVEAGKPNIVGLVDGAIEITASPISSLGGGSTTRFGRLDWRGGLKLTSASDYFGGFSGLAVIDRGRALVAVSDAGFWMTARLTYDGGQLSGLGSGRVGALRAIKGKTLERRRDRDAEAIGVVSSSGASAKLVIGFENNARVGRFDLGPEGVSPPGVYIDLPKAMGALRSNNGIESIARLDAGPLSGNYVAFAETKTDDGGKRIGWVFSGKSSRTLKLAAIGNYDISDIAAMPDGGILVLERRFRWSEGINIRIRRISPKALQANSPILGVTVFEAGSGTAIDNMEGIAVHRSDAGENGEVKDISQQRAQRGDGRGFQHHGRTNGRAPRAQRPQDGDLPAAFVH